MGRGAAGDLCGHHSCPPSWQPSCIYLKLQIIQKRRKLENFQARYVEYDVNKHSAFCRNFLFRLPKQVKTRILFKMLDHLLRMT